MRNRNDGAGEGASLLEMFVDALKETQLSDAQRQALGERVLAATAECTPPLTETVRAQSVPWQQAWTGVWLRVMRRDVGADLQVTVLRIEEGGRVPGHVHAKDEECLVLEGEILIGSHRLRQGDYHLARAGTHHPDITSPSGALLMVRSEIPKLA